MYHLKDIHSFRGKKSDSCQKHCKNQWGKGPDGITSEVKTKKGEKFQVLEIPELKLVYPETNDSYWSDLSTWLHE